MYKLSLLIRRYTAEYGVFLHGSCHLFIRLQSRRIYIVLSSGNPRLSCDLRYGHRIITGNDLDLHILLRKIFKRLFCLVTDWIGKRDIS